jgi:hypothetical protein
MVRIFIFLGENNGIHLTKQHLQKGKAKLCALPLFYQSGPLNFDFSNNCHSKQNAFFREKAKYGTLREDLKRTKIGFPDFLRSLVVYSEIF